MLGMKMIILKLLPLLLYNGISAAYPAQQHESGIVSYRARTNMVKSFTSSSLHESAPDRLFRRQDARSEEFMKDAVKGAQRWKVYQSMLWEGQSGPSTDVPIVHDTARTVGWTKNAHGHDIPTSANKIGWRFWASTDGITDELKKTIRLAMPGVKNIQLTEISANEWMEPEFSITASFDCNNGIIISSLAYFRITVKNNGKPTLKISQYRWSDVMWGLWTAVCPDQKERLRYFIRDNIANKDSRSIMKEAAIAAGHYHTSKKDWDLNDKQVTIWKPTQLKLGDITENSCDAAAGDCDFYAVLHTPNAIGILWLAQGHANELSYDSINKITGISFWTPDMVIDGDSDSNSNSDDDEDDDENLRESELEEMTWYSVIELGVSSKEC
ncbi:hypothetical protein N7495_002330 [Penicillium taxi]|uniref:uncharacterized protein n=1 Tax=Penicillium taxi TaxID=168475 RepID=UPI0025456F91|nr:uncharacterized protein N7495_002330 [Penicillium taxi]KAJ5901802.1 hypothetical protein N7495_002330 [Penicillium taxi]